MRILVVNDDGITANGIIRLAKMAKQLGEVTVVAPDAQCSAMSQRITVRGPLIAQKADFPVEGVDAYHVGGTPADCVKLAVQCFLNEKPDIVFSGINCGYNVGCDILYSGTVGAAMEALLQGIPAIAFSSDMNENYEVVDEYLLPITKQLLEKPSKSNEIWNVNFPGCGKEQLQGIQWDCFPSEKRFFVENYDKEETAQGKYTIGIKGILATKAETGSDGAAVLANYIAVGKVKNMILK